MGCFSKKKKNYRHRFDKGLQSNDSLVGLLDHSGFSWNASVDDPGSVAVWKPLIPGSVLHRQARSGGCSLAWKFSLGIGHGVFDLRIQSLVCVLAIHLNFSLNCFRALSTLGEEAHTVLVYSVLWFHLILEKSLCWGKGTCNTQSAQ